MLQLTLKHAPRKESQKEVISRKRRGNRHIYVLKRRWRKLNVRIRALQQAVPDSNKIPKLQDEVALLCHDIQEGIVKKLNKREKTTVEAIRKNPKYFLSYAKRLQKTKSTIPVLRDGNGTLVGDSSTKAELLQGQYQKVFSDPEKADRNVYEKPRTATRSSERV